MSARCQADARVRATLGDGVRAVRLHPDVRRLAARMFWRWSPPRTRRARGRPDGGQGRSRRARPSTKARPSTARRRARTTSACATRACGTSRRSCCRRTPATTRRAWGTSRRRSWRPPRRARPSGSSGTSACNSASVDDVLRCLSRAYGRTFMDVGVFIEDALPLRRDDRAGDGGPACATGTWARLLADGGCTTVTALAGDRHYPGARDGRARTLARHGRRRAPAPPLRGGVPARLLAGARRRPARAARARGRLAVARLVDRAPADPAWRSADHAVVCLPDVARARRPSTSSSCAPRWRDAAPSCATGSRPARARWPSRTGRASSASARTRPPRATRRRRRPRAWPTCTP